MGLFDKREKQKIRRKVVAPVQWILENATGAQLDVLNRFSHAHDFADFVNLVNKFKHYNIYEVYLYDAKDPEDLAYFRAAKRGELAGLDALLDACQLARGEIERRKKGKKTYESA